MADFPRRCKYCGDDFIAKRARARFCSKECIDWDWAERNYDKLHARSKAYYAANAEAEKERARAWQAANVERKKSTDALYRKRNKATIATYQREYYLRRKAARMRAQAMSCSAPAAAATPKPPITMAPMIQSI